MKVHFTADYDHRWPSRAVTAFKSGWSGTVKREVGEAAIAKGRATEITARAKAHDDGKAPTTADVRGRRGMAGRDDADHVGAIVQSSAMDIPDQ